MTFILIFTAGYLVGGVSALFLLALTVAARQGDHEHAKPTPIKKRI